MTVTPCPSIEIEGPADVRGRQYGRLAGERIAAGVRHYTEQLNRAEFGATALRDAVAELLPLIDGFDAGFVPEMRAIAAGAEQPFEHIVLLNARTELLQIARRRKVARGGADEDPDGCTGLVVLPAATRAGRLIHAQNWDWKAECAETAIVLKVAADGDKPALMTFTEAGALGRCGFNAAGIAITANYLESDRDYSQSGVPLALIRRKVLEQQHLALAMRAVYCTGKAASNNMIVSHAQGIVIDFECAPDETFQVQAQNGLLVHANHWQSAVALAKLKDTGISATPDSLYRDLRVRELLAPSLGHIEIGHVKAALFDRFGGDWAVCRPPRRTLSNNLSASVAMVVMEPAAGTMEVAMLPALNREFRRYTLETRFQPVVAEVAA
ncbi:MAG: C45 family peptidase [Rubrivivax sp.]